MRPDEQLHNQGGAQSSSGSPQPEPQAMPVESVQIRTAPPPGPAPADFVTAQPQTNTPIYQPPGPGTEHLNAPVARLNSQQIPAQQMPSIPPIEPIPQTQQPTQTFTAPAQQQQIPQQPQFTELSQPIQPAVQSTQPVVQPVQSAATHQHPAQQQTQMAAQPVLPVHQSSTLVPKKSGMSRTIRFAFAGLVALAVVGGALFAGVRLLSPDAVFASLEPDIQQGIQFMRPRSFMQVASVQEDVTTFTPSGTAEDDSVVGIVLTSSSIGLMVTDLEQLALDDLKRSFKDEFTKEQSFDLSECETFGTTTFSEVTRTGYDLAFDVEARCTKLKNTAQGSYIRVVLGVSGSVMHVFAVSAEDDVWQADIDAITTIIESVQPAE